MTALTADMLVAGCRDDSDDAGISIRSTLDPLGGEGAPVKPATYEGGRFQHGRRWWGEGVDRRPVDILVIDNEPSQANRLEAALEDRRAELGLPEILLDLSSAGTLPAHLPRRISSFRFPHRNADAYLRDAMLNGKQFLSSEPGRAIFDATADRPEALLQWCPQALLFGFWQSHLGKKRSQAKLARAWTSEIIGVEPAVDDIRRLGLKGDPLNLSVEDRAKFDENDLVHEEWQFATTGKKLADIGHGQVPVAGEEAALVGVSFREVVQQATVSFASLRRVRAATGAAEARALLASLGLLAHVAAFGHPFSLRSGADLRPRSTEWTWLGGASDTLLDTPNYTQVVSIFRDCADRAEAVGLPVGSRWAADPLLVEPAPNLLQAIQKSWPAG
jgi:CRISPR-associated protein Csb1